MQIAGAFIFLFVTKSVLTLLIVVILPGTSYDWADFATFQSTVITVLFHFLTTIIHFTFLKWPKLYFPSLSPSLLVKVPCVWWVPLDVCPSKAVRLSPALMALISTSDSMTQHSSVTLKQPELIFAAFWIFKEKTSLCAEIYGLRCVKCAVLPWKWTYTVRLIFLSSIIMFYFVLSLKIHSWACLSNQVDLLFES